MDNNNYNYGSATPYSNSAMPTYGAPMPQKKSNGFGTASLVLGILSLTICCLIGPLLGLIGIIFGIVGLCKKNAKKGTSIAGLITSVLGVIISILLYALMVRGTIEFANYAEETMNEAIESINPFYDHTFEASDGSTIYFERDYSFIWYLSDDDHSDNYSSGTYIAYKGEEARDYLSQSLSEIGLAEEDVDDFIYDDTGLFESENFCILILYNQEKIMDGESINNPSYTSCYFGYYENGTYDAANMSTGNPAYFTMIE